MQTISDASVFEDAGSDKPFVELSTHTEAHCEFGETCNAKVRLSMSRNETIDLERMIAMLRIGRLIDDGIVSCLKQLLNILTQTFADGLKVFPRDD